jgi:type III restriction enzyme
MHLYEILAQRVDEWRRQGYTHDNYATIAEILEWAADPDGVGFQLRSPQLRALETYWYLRLQENTPHIAELYRGLFSRTGDLLRALGIPAAAFERVDFALDSLWESIRTDDAFVKEFKLEALRETLTLAYPSYILALAMGAGKTALIGTIIATEFGMALEYPEADFVQNALVFAPGKTIIESLRELAEIEYERILPPRLYKSFAASVKLTFTRDGEKDIPVVRGSLFNVVVTNTEKIRIQKSTIRKRDLGAQLLPAFEDEAKVEVANRRLQAIASLPHLAVFSDEAHHTYGRALDRELKKVRKTVDYLHEASPNMICVVNTTGTPYFQRQLLRDVVIWYGLSQGINDGILKEVAGNIHAFSFDNTEADQFVAHVVADFFKDYGEVSLPNGARAKLAIYFPQTDDLAELRPVIEAKLVELGYSPEIVLRNTNESSQMEIDAFNRLNDPDSRHRVILLVNKGTEGWNCLSLFSCALARRLRGSNNFVLQAASRCLRQVPGNTRKARIYLSMDNRSVLDRQLQETYGETIEGLNQSQNRSRRATIKLRKIDLPPLVVKQLVRTVVRKEATNGPLKLAEPAGVEPGRLERVTYDIAEQMGTTSVLKQVADVVEIETVPATLDCYGAAVELAAIYRLPVWTIYDELRRIYGEEPVPEAHLVGLREQIEAQTRNYEVQEEIVELSLALVKPEGFKSELTAEGNEVYTAEIAYPVEREQLLLGWEAMHERNDGAYGFHYSPYNFDSNPEKSFFGQLLEHLNQHPEQVEDIYFTGALTDPKKTDFYVEYKGEDEKWHHYTPDFVIRRKDGRCLIVEIKSAQFEAATKGDLARYDQGEAVVTVEGRKAVALKKWAALDRGRLKYEIIFAREEIGYDQTHTARLFVEEA